MKIPVTLNLGVESLYKIAYQDTVLNSCRNNSNDTLIANSDQLRCSGQLTVAKLDTSAGIVSGTFNATLFKPGCDTLKITEGRFDMKF